MCIYRFTVRTFTHVFTNYIYIYILYVKIYQKIVEKFLHANLFGLKYIFWLFYLDFVTFLCDKYPDVMDEGITESKSYTSHIANILKVQTVPVSLGEHDTAALLMGKCNLSQRSYKNLKKILKTKSVMLPRYDSIMSYIKDLDVGKLDRQLNHEGCMCVSTTIKDTLQHIVSSELFKLFTFKSVAQQEKLFAHLKFIQPQLYSLLDKNKRTLFLRETGDNFRASARFPTEQISFSLLNMTDLLSSPYGQFVTSLWRGMEYRENLKNHVTAHYE